MIEHLLLVLLWLLLRGGVVEPPPVEAPIPAAGRSSLVARLAHNQEVVGSNPTPATPH